MNSDLDAIRRIVEAFERSDWREIDVRSGDLRVHLSSDAGDALTTAAPVERPAPTTGSEVDVEIDADGRPAGTTAPAPASVPADAHIVTSPSPGIFWRAPEPGAPPFTEVGDPVEPASTLCIIEVMKLMNHLKAGVSGHVVAIHVENGVAVAKDETSLRDRHRGAGPVTSTPSGSLRRVLVANRGEIAVRLVRACLEEGIEAVVAVSEADQDSLAARLAHDVVHIGPASPAQSYLRVEQIIAGALLTGCDGVHPGYGFLSERPELADACEANGLTFVGPSADTIRRGWRQGRGPGAGSCRGSPDRCRVRHGGQRGGRPRGSRRGGLSGAAQGGGRRRRPRHGRSRQPRGAGRAIPGGLERGCGGFRRRPSVLGALCRERPPCRGPAAGGWPRKRRPTRRPRLLGAAPVPEAGRGGSGVEPARRAPREACRGRGGARPQLRYEGAGTVEFLVDLDRGEFSFLEINTRIQVEHPVTEVVTGVDIVREQLRIAAGQPLSFPRTR